MANNHYDAIVVGSGISGGWAAKELTEKGLKVLLLERGRNLEHIKDYTNAHKEVWDYPHRNVPTQQMKEDYPVLKRDFPLNEAQLGWWTDEQKSPYIEDKRFDWYRSWPGVEERPPSGGLFRMGAGKLLSCPCKGSVQYAIHRRTCGLAPVVFDFM